jgi:hypothetical protein
MATTGFDHPGSVEKVVDASLARLEEMAGGLWRFQELRHGILDKNVSAH